METLDGLSLGNWAHDQGRGTLFGGELRTNRPKRFCRWQSSAHGVTFFNAVSANKANYKQR